MATTTLDGYGSVYCQTWFGDVKNIEHSIVEYPDCMYNQYFQDYYDRVIADGATFEGGRCLALALDYLKSN